MGAGQRSGIRLRDEYLCGPLSLRSNEQKRSCGLKVDRVWLRAGERARI
jgi:hypothetical protein